MRNLYFEITILGALFLFIIFGCNPKESATPPQEEDTRKLVKAAYDSADRRIVNIAFNAERALILKANAEQETDPIKKMNTTLEYAHELLKSGSTKEAINLYNTVFQYVTKYNIQFDSVSLRNLYSMIGISYMRYGENENCVLNHNHQSCFIPITGDGVHQLPIGSSNAISAYTGLLKRYPGDLESMYLLNIAYMTLGQYPEKVPPAYLINPSWFKSRVNIKPFKDIAPELGVNRNGLAGGVVMDDFTNDGWLDIVITSWGADDQMMLYINNGDGTFTDQTKSFGLEGYKGGLHINQTDFNNDGWLDLYIMRGAWFQSEGDIPNTLLMNTGKGSFVDVTIKAGLTHHAATQTSAWTDINLDGWLDLVIANESLPDQNYLRGIDVYINQKNGTFSHQSVEYGLRLNYYFKGCVATDVNNDKYPDLFFTTLNDGTLLFINQEGITGQKGFKLAPIISISNEPARAFPCWSFDFNNDGNEDLFASGYTNDGTPATHWMLSHLGKADPSYLPKLYRNKGNMNFDEVGIEMGLSEVAFTMGCNFGDINTDGFLDFYLATGNPLYQSLVPNKMYLNMDGRKFEDVSYSGGFANIQKGHGVSFGDWDHDGDEDIYAVIGGGYEGDMFFNCFFENPNEHNNNWVILKLTGKKANTAAIGARVTISVQEDGRERKIYRTVTSGASFGANSLILEIGLRKASAINNVTIQWPCKNCQDQVFTGFEINKAYTITQNQTSPASMTYEKVTVKEGDEHTHHTHH